VRQLPLRIRNVGFQMPIPAWLSIFLLENVPNALLIAYEWVREWQILLAAILLIFALAHFTRAIIEAFRDLAEVVTRSTRISAVTSASRAVPYSASQAAPYKEKKEPTPPPVSERSSLHPGEKFSQADHPPSTDLLGRLDALRNAIRVALAAIPPTQSKVAEKGLKLYGDVAAVSLGDVADILTDQETLALGRALEGALAQLRFETGDGLDPRLAWESLARINRLARALQIKMTPSDAAAIEKQVLEEAG